MKQLYILLISICILIIINYIYKSKKTKKKNIQKKRGGGILENFNNKTTYFKIKLETPTTPTEKKLITSEQTATGPEIKIINDTTKINDIPHANIW